MRFDSYHPTINLIYFASVITATICFQHPIFLAISFLCSFVYSVKLGGWHALAFDLCLIPLATLWAVYYAAYHHFGVTPLQYNFIGNAITLEALAYGGALGAAGASMAMWMSCVHRVFCTDKIVYLFGRVSPKLSLFLAMLLRMIPRIKAHGRRIAVAQYCIGRGIRQGGVLRMAHNGWRMLSILLTWTLESFVTTADSMRSRGYTLKGRTAFSIYRFDDRDRAIVIAMFTCLSVILVGVLFDQTRIHYDPRIILNRITPLSGVFYAAYAALCLIPMGLQVCGEISYLRSSRKAYAQ